MCSGSVARRAAVPDLYSPQRASFDPQWLVFVLGVYTTFPCPRGLTGAQIAPNTPKLYLSPL
jgi:hypothetical protein